MQHLLLLIAIISLSQSANLVRWANAPNEVFGTWRMLGASLVMLIVCFVSRLPVTKLKKKQWLWTTFAGFLIFSHLWTFFFAAQNTSIANTMVLFASNPIWTALGSILFTGEKLKRPLIISIAISVLAIWVMFSNRFSFQEMRLGDLSALLSAFLYSCYMLASLAARRTGVQNKLFSFWIYGICGVCFLALGLARDVQFTSYPMHTWVAIAGSILFPTLLGHALFTYLLHHININWLSTGKLAEPVMSAFIAWIAFSEPLQPQTILAFVLISMSLLNLYRPWKYIKR
jgi:drug/metabolite transporter (DMT)-like permease